MWISSNIFGRSSSILGGLAVKLRVLLVFFVLASMTTDDGQARKLEKFGRGSPGITEGRWNLPSDQRGRQNSTRSKGDTMVKMTAGQQHSKRRSKASKTAINVRRNLLDDQRQKQNSATRSKMNPAQRPVRVDKAKVAFGQQHSTSGLKVSEMTSDRWNLSGVQRGKQNSAFKNDARIKMTTGQRPVRVENAKVAFGQQHSTSRLKVSKMTRDRWHHSGVQREKQNSAFKKDARIKVTTGQGPARVDTAKMTTGQSRSYGGSGYGGGGGSNYLYQNAGHLMYFSNFDTALTTLAFLSFGVFLLNMLLSLFDLGGSGDALGGQKRDRERRWIDINPLTPVHWILFSALQHQLTTELTNEDDRSVCNFSALCMSDDVARISRFLRPVVTSMISSSSMEYGAKSGNHTLIKTEMENVTAILENGGCARIRKACTSTLHARLSR